MTDVPGALQLVGHALVALACCLPLGCAGVVVDPDKPHHTANGFRNVPDDVQPRLVDFLKWRWDRLRSPAHAPATYRPTPAPSQSAYLRANRTHTTLTWIGHATVLLQLQGRNILTDPQFSQRASPVQWAGPKRVVEPVPALAELPPIDMVVISHDHYDSLDQPTILRLHRRPGGERTTFLVPLGLKRWFTDRGIERVIELDWWQQYDADGLAVIAVPVQHWSKRRLLSRNRTLWAGWVVRSPRFRFFFGGDSGYAPHFAEIGRRLGPFDLAAIPIGAYEPQWFMRRHHMNPEDAVQVHRDLRARRSVGIHWGTFVLTDEPLDEPPRRLEQARRAHGLGAEEFVTLRHGETLILD